MDLIKKYSQLFLLLSITLLAACGDDDEDVNPETGIVGTWRLIDGEYSFNNLSLRDYYRQIFEQAGLQVDDQTLDQAVALVEQTLDENFNDGTTYEFQAGGNFVSSGPNSNGSGTWEIQNNNQLVIEGGGDRLEFTIVNLTSSELRLLLEEEDTVDFSDIGLSDSEPVTIGLTFTFNKQ